ncbi:MULTISPECIES: hypothetical protein [Parabacteroides]|uniref:Outer membrane protein beta-barrel domain-containing protein n=3 Tax=Tannerellaceae TaxID=2005525 RepID=A0A6G1ZF37_9BACT|nr:MULTISPECIES: hypothetical protein [Parabacteroides]EOS14037.1 hypothetical protein C803_04863 [Parabacteroides goldsteinii dnLKV18]KAI4358805.1 hypothetical protein C825_000835 [Parabacteroides sp. ASF519]MBF0766027.1 hypothetical protein [Parabacteroides goldsteinii]MDZ3927994.1 hypothetical protein [Parabacteroides goldsteinii]MRX92689.1 hypothetical protein [Parabacteroides goldsteinii]
MKRILLLIGFVLSLFTSAQAADIEARTGVMGGDVWGLHAGAYINFPQSKLFSIQTGFLLHTANQWIGKKSDMWDIDVNVPVYVSFHIPLSEKTNLRLNGGAYVGTGHTMQLGATADVGVEVKRMFVGVNCFQNCINTQEFLFGVSVGYKFHL